MARKENRAANYNRTEVEMKMNQKVPVTNELSGKRKFLKSILNVAVSCAPSWSWLKIGPNALNWTHTTGVKKAAATINARRLHGAVVTFTSPESHLVSLSIQSFETN